MTIMQPKARLTRKVWNVLLRNPEGLSLRKLSKEVSISIYQVGRIVALLEREGRVTELKAGRAKVVIPATAKMRGVESPTTVLWGLLGKGRVERQEAGEEAMGEVATRRITKTRP